MKNSVKGLQIFHCMRIDEYWLNKLPLASYRTTKAIGEGTFQAIKDTL